MKIKDSYLELLFENRNKAYGAYELRTHYNDRLLKAFGMALLIASLFFLIPYGLTLIFTHPKIVAKPDEVTLVQLYDDFVFDVKPKITPPASHVIAENSMRVVRNNEVTETKDEPKKDNTDGTATAITETGATTDNSGGGETSDGDPLPVPAIAEPMNLASVDVAPSFPGGESAMMKFLGKNLHYSAFARENGIAGKIYVAFIVNEKGDITDVQLKRNLEQSLDAEVMRVVHIMPKWTPGMYHGQAVKTTFMLPVTFALK
jgi:protein TonB